MPILSDEELIAAARSDPGQFTGLFDRHYATIHGYLRRRLGPELADELAAETFIRAFQDRRRYDPERGAVRLWLFGIATNLLRRHHRSEHRRLAAYARSPIEDRQEDQTAAVDSRVAAQALGGGLAKALAAMRDQDRDVLVLIAWADLTYAETATALGIPIGTVRSRLARARREVRRFLPEVDAWQPQSAEPQPDDPPAARTKGVVLHG